MEGDSIRLIQYRNYTDTIFPLAQHTVFVGPNGSGKTNVIEAIRAVSVTKSYRVVQDRDVIQWGEQYCRALLTINNESFEYVLTVEPTGVKKAVKHNGVIIPLPKVYGLVPTVLFTPETMQLIDGAPQERRRFLDTVLSQVDPDYLVALITYKKVLRERHFVLLRILNGLGNEDELDYWDGLLEENGAYIIQERTTLIDQLNTLLKEVYASFIEAKEEQFRMQYKPVSTVSELGRHLKNQRRYDIKTGTTTRGPHRDELSFLLQDRDVMLFASRGELRRCVLALKIAEAHYVKHTKQKEPIILLDDVFSEFDATRRKRLRSAIEGYRTVITTTDASFVASFTKTDSVVHTLPKEE